MSFAEKEQKYFCKVYSSPVDKDVNRYCIFGLQKSLLPKAPKQIHLHWIIEQIFLWKLQL